MAYLKRDVVKGHDYYRIVESFRDPYTKKPKKRTIFQIGRIDNLFKLLPSWVRNGKGPPPEERDPTNPSGSNQETIPSDPPDIVPDVHKTDSPGNPSASSSASSDTPGDSEQSNSGQLSSLSPELTIDSVRCREHGDVYLLYSVAEWLGVRDLMDSFFPAGTSYGVERAQSLLLAAIQRACRPGSKSEFANWFRYTSLPDRLKLDPDIFTSGHFWEQMDKITVEQIKEFETALYERILGQFPEIQEVLKRLSIDFTNYFTYIANRNYRCKIAQYGHSKEGRSGQRIFSVAVITTPLLGIPIATMVYRGNLNDKTALPSFISELKERLKDIIDLNDITFVFDGGGASEDTLKALPGHFITRGSIRNSPELYDVPLSDYVEYELKDGRKVRAYQTTAVQYGQERPVVISLSEELRGSESRELDKRLSKFDAAIKNLCGMLVNPRATSDKRLDAIKKRVTDLSKPVDHFDDFVTVEYQTVEQPDPNLLKQFEKHEKDWRKKKKQEPDSIYVPLQIADLIIQSVDDIPRVQIVSSVSYTIDEEKKGAMIDKYYGKHMLVTNHIDWETIQILEVYRDQEVIERYFRDSKSVSHFAVRPVYHWTDSKIAVHVMLCYLGLSLCRVAQYVLRAKFDYKIDTIELMDRLSRVQECTVFITYKNIKLVPYVMICQLEPNEQETWSKVLLLIDYMKNNPVIKQRKRRGRKKGSNKKR